MKYKLLALPGALARLAGGLLYPPLGRWGDQVTNRSWPNVLLPPSELATLRRREQLGNIDFYDEAKAQGLQDFRAEALYQLSERLLDINELTNLRLRGQLSAEDYIAKAAQYGMTEENAEKVYRLVEQRIDPLTLIRAFWRGLGIGKSEEKVRAELSDQGWTKERIDTLLDVSKFYPSAQDLVLWQAREVYEPDAIEKYGLKDELDRLTKEPFYKAGIDDDQIANYWMAHWRHASWDQVREMMFRAGLEEKDVWEWFRLVEIPPYWRDKMIKIMYRPFTRVDVRRMHKVGILTEEELKRSYMDLGYNDEKAGKMTDFTIAYNEDPEEEEMTEADRAKAELRGVTRATTIKAFKQGRIPEDEARGYLTDLGFTDVVIDFFIAQADYELSEDREEGYIKAYHRMFVNGVNDINKTSDLLDELDIPAKQKEYLLDLWAMEIIQKTAQPSKAELIKFTKKKILTINKFKEMMSNLGYAAEYIDWYIKDNKLAKVET